MTQGIVSQLQLSRKNGQFRVVRHCIDCGKPLPRHGNNKSVRCRHCNAIYQSRQRSVNK